jgi:E3 ubiquitin-protein ligase RNF5
MSFGIGAFPFGFFASAFNWGGAGQGPQVVGGVNQAALEEQEFLSKVFLWVALVFMVWLLLA